MAQTRVMRTGTRPAMAWNAGLAPLALRSTPWRADHPKTPPLPDQLMLSPK